MSAFIVPDLHIQTLVAWGFSRGLIADPETAAAELYAANEHSVNVRYRENTKRDDFAYIEPPAWREVSQAQIVTACDCLDYQSCEFEGWPNTSACRLLKRIREAALLEHIKTHGAFTDAQRDACRWTIDEARS